MYNLRSMLFCLVFTCITGLFCVTALSGKFTNPGTDGPSNQLFSITGAFTLMAEHEHLALYLNEQSLAIRLLNKRTGYIWSSDIDDFGEDYLNDRWKGFINSGVTIEYFLARRNTAGRTAIDRTATEESFLESGFSAAAVTKIPKGFRVRAVFGNSGIGISYETLLTETGIETALNPEDIEETESERIVSVQFYPFLGAVRHGTQQGYFVLPDGDGSLIRFDRVYTNITRNYQKRYFGADRGISPVPEDALGFTFKESEQLNYPVYGIVHGIHANALVNEILSGAAFAELLVYPAGVRTNYYFISNRYLLRQPYTYIVSTGNQTTMLTPDRANIRIREGITVLEEERADYVGIAQTYRKNLLEQGLLRARIKPGEPDIPLYLNVLAGAANEGIFRNNPILMTSIPDLSAITADLKSREIGNLQVRYCNMWRRELSGSEQDRYALWPGAGSLGELRELDRRLRETGGRLIIDAYPGIAFSRIRGLDLKEEVIRNINKQYLIETARHGAVTKAYHNLNSAGTVKLLLKDAEVFREQGFLASNLEMENPASSFNRETVWRDAALIEIAQALGRTRETMDYISMPRRGAMPEYFSHLDALMGVTMRTALFPYITDTIPFTALVLRGFVDLFTENLNNTANPQETLLRMIEWGVYPAYLITEEDADKLLYSDMQDFQSSKYTNWRAEILEVYAQVNKALKPVIGAPIGDHEALAEGVMKTRYENGVSVYVNYNSSPWEGEGLRLSPQTYEVRLP